MNFLKSDLLQCSQALHCTRLSHSHACLGPSNKDLYMVSAWYILWKCTRSLELVIKPQRSQHCLFQNHFSYFRVNWNLDLRIMGILSLPLISASLTNHLHRTTKSSTGRIWDWLTGSKSKKAREDSDWLLDQLTMAGRQSNVSTWKFTFKLHGWNEERTISLKKGK